VALQPPHGVIAKLFQEGAIVPFLGAGVNFGTRQPPNAQWNEKTSTFLPSGAELSRFLAGDCGFPSKEEQDLDDRAKVPTPLLIVTTNYDDLTERAFAAAGRQYDLVVHANESQEVYSTPAFQMFSFMYAATTHQGRYEGCSEAGISEMGEQGSRALL